MDAATVASRLDRPLATEIARRVLERPAADLLAWEPPVPLTEAAAITNPAAGGVYRVRGRATDGGHTIRWSAILKIVHSPAGTTAPDGTYITSAMAEDSRAFLYWRREPLAYQSGLLADLPGGLATPRCLAVRALADEAVWLWLEDLDDGRQAEWSIDRYALAARHLGAFNGAYLAGRPLPDAAWLSSGYLRDWVGKVVAGIAGFLGGSDVWSHPLVRAVLPDSTATRLRHLWSERDSLLDRLDRLPQALCHLDAFRSNLVDGTATRGENLTIAFDWSFAGQAGLGEELAPFVVATILYGHLPAERIEELERAALDGYVQGLGDAGWDGGPQAARLGYLSSAPLRYAHLVTADIVRLAIDEQFRAATERRHNRDHVEIARERATLLRLLLDRADAALASTSDEEAGSRGTMANAAADMGRASDRPAWRRSHRAPVPPLPRASAPRGRSGRRRSGR